MGEEIYPLIFFGFIALSVGIYVFSRSLDRPRIQRYLAERRATLIDCVWTPFGPGWYGEKDSRIYRITYRDREGQIHKAHVKTSMYSGVYLNDDKVVSAGARTAISLPNMKPSAPVVEPTNSTGNQEWVEVEKRRLRARLAELEQRYPTGE